MLPRFHLRKSGDGAAKLTFSGRNGLLALEVIAGRDVNQGDPSMAFMGPFVSKFSVVVAYAAFAFVGAVYLASHGFSARYLATAIGVTQCLGMLGGSAGQFESVHW